MKKIAVGVIGTGFIGPVHVEALRRSGMVDVVAIADKNEQVVAEKAEQLGIEKFYSKWEKLVADPDIEAVHVCTPNKFHYLMSKAALEAGKHVVCEKPLAMNAQESGELVQLAKRTGLVNVVHFNLRYYPLIHQARAMLEKEEIGKVFAIHGSYLQDWLLFANDYNWRLEPESSGELRAVADIGSHWLDLVEFVSGLRITAVCADLATFHPTRKKPLKPIQTFAGKMFEPKDYEEISIKTEDYATVMLEFENGAKGVMTVSQAAAGRKNRIFFEIDGAKSALAWNSERPNELWIRKRNSNNEIMIKDPSLMEPAATEIADFPGGHVEGFPDTSKQLFKKVYSYISSGAYKEGIVPTFPTFKDGHREIVIGDAILKSGRERSWVEINFR